MRTLRFFAAVLIAAAIGGMSAPAGAQTPRVTPPLSVPQARYYQQHPQELQQLLDRLSQGGQQFTPGTPLAVGATPSAGTWTTLTNLPAGGTVAVQNPLLMTDGTVIAMAACTGHWYKLTPDVTGSYLNGTWTTIATMPSGYGPLFGGSAVLPDGRVIFEGGEYNDATQSGDCNNAVWTSLGAIYDPVANTWTNVNPPPFWTATIFGSPGIGDAAGIVLDNGTYMQSACCFNVSTSNPSGVSALFNPSTLTWTTTGSGKRDPWDEEGMAKLQNGNVLVVDANIAVACNNAAEIYNATAGTFSATGSTVDQEPDCSNPTNSKSFELGPLVVRQDGSAVIFPGILCSDAQNANCSSQAAGFVVVPKIDLYNVGAGTWSTLATLPQIVTPPFNNNPGGNFYYSLADAPAAVLPDGNILFAASPSFEAFVPPTHFFELNFSSGTITQVGDTAEANSSNGGAYEQNFLSLPTGQVLAVSQLGNVQIYQPLAGSPQAGWAPVITSAPGCVSPGKTYLMSGTQLNGLTEGSYYGDDVQAAVNFPIVRIVNNSTSNVYYAKTFNHSSRSIAPNAAVRTNFTVASGTALGASKLYDVGAGIASAGTPITVKASCLTDTHDFNADGRSDIAWRDTSGDVAFWLMNGTAVSSTGSVGGVPSTWSIVGQRDFNGDGKADLLWLDTSGNIAMWFMNGAAVGSTAVVTKIPTNWSVAGVADFDGDGFGDILWRDTAGNYAMWLMNGATVTSAVGLGNVPLATWSVVGTGDFNGDGMADILWRDTSGDVSIWFMNGTAVTSTAPVGTIANWSVVGTGDFNGDGMSDIVWRNTAGDAAIWLMNGAAVLSAGGLGNVATTWSIVQTGDYNGDGRSDLLWRDTSGNTAMWFMNGAAISSTGTVGNVSTIWTVQGMNVD
jgi:FG-GAP-like repeat